MNKQEQAATVSVNTLSPNPDQSETKPPTFGQKLADKLAARVGSWPFLIGQSTILAGWVGCNLMPGMPHWDESPFIMLNLVFSFASAYTAPIVLMSQNRQSDEDREHSRLNYRVNVQTAENLQLLQTKMDEVYSQKLAELTQLIQQQQALTANQSHPTKSEPVAQLHLPHYIGLLPTQVAPRQETLASIADNPLFNHYQANRYQANVPDTASVEPATSSQRNDEPN